MTDSGEADAGVDLPACLVLHGLGGGPYELAPLIDRLRGEGFVVESPTLPGHDTPGPIMPASCWSDWIRVAVETLQSMAARHRRVAVVGFSTGGTMALYLCASQAVDRQVLIAPFLAIRHTPRIPLPTGPTLALIAKVIPNVPRRAAAVRDRAMREWADSTDRYRTFSLEAARSALELIDLVKPLVPDIKAPTLILQGKRDSVVEPASAAWLHDRLGSTRKSIIWLDHSDHLLALDQEREFAIDAIVAFLREPLGETAGE
jgi:carboxylesterase